MKHHIEHDLDEATARKVTDRAFAEYKARYPSYDPQLRWTSDQLAEISINAKGIRLKGTMEISPKTITMELDVPFLFRPFQKVAIDVIDREVKVWIGKAHEGKL